MHCLLLDLALLTVGAHCLMVGSVLLSVPLYVDRSYIDGGSCVVFIIDTTRCVHCCQAFSLLVLSPSAGRGHCHSCRVPEFGLAYCARKIPSCRCGRSVGPSARLLSA